MNYFLRKFSDHRSDCGTLIAIEDVFILILNLLNGWIKSNYFLVSKDDVYCEPLSMVEIVSDRVRVCECV